MHSFTAQIRIIGVNPYVEVPKAILAAIFKAAGKDKGPIPVHGLINNVTYTQTLVKYAGEWRLYINTKMLKDSPNRVGEVVSLTVAVDSRDRTLPLHPKLMDALRSDTHAQRVFDSLSPSLRHEINRYISGLKSETKVDENVERAIRFLKGDCRFVGRELK